MLNQKRSVIIIGLVIVAAILISNLLSNQKEPMKRHHVHKKEKVVKVMTVQNKEIPTEITMSGYLSALDKVEIAAEVTGILLRTPKRFREGNAFAKTETLIKIDDSVYLNNVLAQKSSLLNQLTRLIPDLSIDFPKSTERWNAYLKAFNINQPLLPLPESENDKERYYIASRNVFNQYYTIKAMEATLAKYTVLAPFSGVVTRAEINPGTLVRVGQSLGEFTDTGVYEVEAAAGIQDVQYLRLGELVTLTSEDVYGEFSGEIKRINAILDRKSQTVKVYIQSRDKRLKDGMYCTAHATTNPIADAIRIPRSLIVGQNHLYTVEDSTLSLTAVNIVANEDEYVIVRGLQNGKYILTEQMTNIFEGMKIKKMEIN